MSRNINFTGIQNIWIPTNNGDQAKITVSLKFPMHPAITFIYIPPTLDTSFTYRPMSNRGSNGVLYIGGLVLGRSISADYKPKSVWTLLNYRLMSDRYASMYDRCDWHRPDSSNMLHESPGHRSLTMGVWPEISPAWLLNRSFKLIKNLK